MKKIEADRRGGGTRCLDVLKILVDKGAQRIGVLFACLIFIHGMRQLRIPAFGDKYISLILDLSFTPQSELGTKEQNGGNTFYFFQVVFWKLIVFLEPLLIIY